jgi:hypothetical protein
MTTIRKVFGRAVLAALVIYTAWAGWQIARFKRYESTILPLADSAYFPAGGTEGVYELEGAYHMHSRFSDGRGTVDEIARVAAGAKLDFIIFTDHGKPNFASLDAQGRKSGVLVLTGSELSVSRGHLVALAFDRPAPDRVFSQNAELAAAEIHALGGFTVIAHPYAKTRWSWGELVDYAGLELIDGDSLIKKNILRRLPYYPLLLVKPSFAILKMIDPPAATLAKWDQLLARRPLRPMLGFYSADAHFLYRAIFPVLHLHVLLDAPPAADFGAARAQIFDALRRGAFYSAIDGAAAARGFRFRRDGPALRVTAPFSFAHETVIIHDGRIIHRSPETEFALPLAGPGVYRAEVFLRERSPLDGGVPWIAANPIAIVKDGR